MFQENLNKSVSAGLYLTVCLHVVADNLTVLLLLLELDGEVADLCDEVGEAGDHLQQDLSHLDLVRFTKEILKSGLEPVLSCY